MRLNLCSSLRPGGTSFSEINPNVSQEILTSLLINPDLWLFLKLEEKASGIWWDPSKGVEAVRQHVIEPENWKSLKSWLSTFPNTFRRARWR